jgi:hypothetical protein
MGIRIGVNGHSNVADASLRARVQYALVPTQADGAWPPFIAYSLGSKACVETRIVAPAHLTLAYKRWLSLSMAVINFQAAAAAARHHF